ncbi:hypothetical protein OUZ56_007510 [Daphnia magna]|uniref:Uncharacterized protein n=1 Tax=Daphnia magna TaxID=35525 RepID=A0ABR0AA56_9CRUS|nr:hypothetical protein OUZ56_007510 [Daphnia magna]
MRLRETLKKKMNPLEAIFLICNFVIVQNHLDPFEDKTLLDMLQPSSSSSIFFFPLVLRLVGLLVATALLCPSCFPLQVVMVTSLISKRL